MIRLLLIATINVVCHYSAYPFQERPKDKIKIGIILAPNGENLSYINEPTNEGISLAVENSPVTHRSYFYPQGNYWLIKNKRLTNFSDDKPNWTCDIELKFSKKNTVMDQFNELVNTDSVLIILGLPSSSLVKAIFNSSCSNIPVISSVATYSGFTNFKKRQFESDTQQKNWTENFKWFFRASSPDIVRMEALVDWFEEEQISNCLVIYSGSDYSEGQLEDFKSSTDQIQGFNYLTKSYAFGEDGINKDSLRAMTDIIADPNKKIHSILVLGISGDNSKLIKQIKKRSRDIPIYVIEPTIIKDKVFWGRQYNDIRALSAQILWNGDYDVKRFTEEFLKRVSKNKFTEQQVIPQSAAFAYDASIIAFSGINNAVSKAKNQWNSLSLQKKRELIRNEIETLNDLPLVMSDGQITQSHEVLAKIQRSYIKDNAFWMYTAVPDNHFVSWFLLLAGGVLAGTSRVVVFISDKLAKNIRPIFPDWKFGLASVIVGVFGALLLKLIWNLSMIDGLLPRVADQLSFENDALVIGFIGGFLPTAVFQFFSKGT